MTRTLAADRNPAWAWNGKAYVHRDCPHASPWPLDFRGTGPEAERPLHATCPTCGQEWHRCRTPWLPVRTEAPPPKTETTP